MYMPCVMVSTPFSAGASGRGTPACTLMTSTTWSLPTRRRYDSALRRTNQPVRFCVKICAALFGSALSTYFVSSVSVVLPGRERS